MKSLIILVCFYLCSQYVLLAQSKIFTVKTGEIVNQVIPLGARYRYEDFKPGSISFYNGQALLASLNYNRLFGEVQFINQQGDTLSLANEQLIKQIIIGETEFYYNPLSGYVETLAQYSDIKLAAKQVLSLTKSGRSGDTGEFSGYYGPGTEDSKGHRLLTEETKAREANKLFTQKAEYPLLFIEEISYYFIDHNNRIRKASSLAIKTIFSRYKKAISKFLDKNQVDFKKEEDLKKLLYYCSQLTE